MLSKSVAGWVSVKTIVLASGVEMPDTPPFIAALMDFARAAGLSDGSEFSKAVQKSEKPAIVAL